MERVTRILVVRHAQSVWNAEGRWQGNADPPLSADGEDQARRAGATLAAVLAGRAEPVPVEGADRLGPVTSVWSSGLQRAARTAALVAQAIGWSEPPEVVPELREHDVGAWSGLTRPEIAARWPGLIEAWVEGRLAVTPGGEPRSAFDARVRAGLTSLADRLGPGLAVVVSHGGVLRAVARWLGCPERPIANLDGYLLLAPSGAEVRHVADVGLLRSPWAAPGCQPAADPPAGAAGGDPDAV